MLLVPSLARPTPEHIELPLVAIAATIPIPVCLPVRLYDANGGEIDGNLTVLNGASAMLFRLEVGDSKATVPREAALSVFRHPNAGDWTELKLKLFLNFFSCQVLWDVLKLDASRISGLLHLLLLLHCEFGLNGLHVEDLPLRCANSSGITSIILVALVFLQVLKTSLDGSDLLSFNVIFTFVNQLVAHPSAKIIILSLDLIVGVPHVIAMEHGDVGITADRVFTALTKAKRVENGILLATISVSFGYSILRLQGAAVKVLHDGASISELSFMNRQAHIR